MIDVDNPKPGAKDSIEGLRNRMEKVESKVRDIIEAVNDLECELKTTKDKLRKVGLALHELEEDYWDEDVDEEEDEE